MMFFSFSSLPVTERTEESFVGREEFFFHEKSGNLYTLNFICRGLNYDFSRYDNRTKKLKVRKFDF